ncbi:4'-phosphopantetheinyl transferase [Yoonia sp. SS1-5]|uniref:Enterobactin synthase component D n=1 Tax=Yoonia rhodophyticola TaxID=3137370 RepID=A0AAN0MCC2_9RHOB
MSSSAGSLPALATMAAGMFPPPFVVAVTDPRADYPDLHPTEAPHTSGMIAKRLREFRAGRHAARTAMRELGLSDPAVPVGPDRAPIWPDGINGSITHCDTACIAIAHRGRETVGIDIEPDQPLPDELIDLVCSPAEQARLATADRGRMARVIFSAKEAVFKAQYPITRQMIDFNAMDITPDLANQKFLAVFQTPVGLFEKGFAITGRIALENGFILSGMTLNPR